MQYSDLKNLIKTAATEKEFQEASAYLQGIIFALNRKQFLPLISEIGSIPENIEHDSSEEKLYAKVSDIILAKCFHELGLKAIVLKERANCADVVAKSQFHNYSLVADAKAFRLSRTAKNQKDFKVESMVHWRGNHNFSVLCCPYFQYPKSQSQIYGQALNGNVSLFAWEYFNLLLQENVVESSTLNLSKLWNYSSLLAKDTTVQNKDMCFLTKQNMYLSELLNYPQQKFSEHLDMFKQDIIDRGEQEIEYWEEKIQTIQNYSKKQAIDMLIKSLKLREKISSIQSYINQLQG